MSKDYKQRLAVSGTDPLAVSGTSPLAVSGSIDAWQSAGKVVVVEVLGGARRQEGISFAKISVFSVISTRCLWIWNAGTSHAPQEHCEPGSDAIVTGLVTS